MNSAPPNSKSLTDANTTPLPDFMENFDLLMRNPSKNSLPFMLLAERDSTLVNLPLHPSHTDDDYSHNLVKQILGRRKVADVIKQYKTVFGSITRKIHRQRDVEKYNKEKRNLMTLNDLLTIQGMSQSIFIQNLQMQIKQERNTPVLFVLEYELIKRWIPTFKAPNPLIVSDSTEMYKWAEEITNCEPIQFRWFENAMAAIEPNITSKPFAYFNSPHLTAISKAIQSQESVSILAKEVAFLHVIFDAVCKQLDPYLEDLFLSLEKWDDYTIAQREALAQALFAFANLYGRSEIITVAFSITPELSEYFAHIRLIGGDDESEGSHTIDWSVDASTLLNRKPFIDIIKVTRSLKTFAEYGYANLEHVEQIKDAVESLEKNCVAAHFQQAFQLRNMLSLLRNRAQQIVEEHQDILKELTCIDDYQALKDSVLNFATEWIDACDLIQGCKVIDEAINTTLSQVGMEFNSLFTQAFRVTLPELDFAYQNFLDENSRIQSIANMSIIERTRLAHAEAEKLESALNQHLDSLKQFETIERPDLKTLQQQYEENKALPTDAFGLPAEHEALIALRDTQSLLDTTTQKAAQLEQKLTKLSADKERLIKNVADLKSAVHQSELRIEQLEASHKMMSRSIDPNVITPEWLELFPSLVKSASPKDLINAINLMLPNRMEVFPSAIESAESNAAMIPMHELAKTIISLCTIGLDALREGFSLHDLNELIGGNIATHESATVQRNERLRKHRRFTDTLGNKVEIFSHMPVSNQTRLYFDYDKGQDKIRLGYIGKHLPTSNSTTI